MGPPNARSCRGARRHAQLPRMARSCRISALHIGIAYVVRVAVVVCQESRRAAIVAAMVGRAAAAWRQAMVTRRDGVGVTARMATPGGTSGRASRGMSPMHRPAAMRVSWVSNSATRKFPNNVRRQWRQARADAGLEWVTPHTFRKTVATLIDKEADTKTAAAQLGHASEQITDTYYIAKPILAPDVSEILEQLGADREPHDLTQGHTRTKRAA